MVIFGMVNTKSGLLNLFHWLCCMWLSNRLKTSLYYLANLLTSITFLLASFSGGWKKLHNITTNLSIMTWINKLTVAIAILFSIGKAFPLWKILYKCVCFVLIIGAVFLNCCQVSNWYIKQKSILTIRCICIDDCSIRNYWSTVDNNYNLFIVGMGLK